MPKGPIARPKNIQHYKPFNSTEKDAKTNPNTTVARQKTRNIAKPAVQPKKQRKVRKVKAEIVEQVKEARSKQVIKSIQSQLYCRIACYIDRLFLHTPYGIDTYYVCFQLLNRLKTYLQQNDCKLYAAALFMMAVKVHEFKLPSTDSLLKWGGFSQTELVVAQGKLLKNLDFRIPASLNFTTTDQMKKATQKLLQRFKVSFKPSADQ